MSRARHDERHPVRWFGLGFRASILEPPAAPGWCRVVFTRSGACIGRAPNVLAAITPRAGMVVPDGVRFALHATADVDLRMLYLRAERVGGGAEVRAVVVTPLLRELVERTVQNGALDGEQPRDRHVIDVVFDEVGGLVSAAGALALPTDPRARRAAERCLAGFDTAPTAARLAAVAGTSQRTLERLFVAQTGFSVRRWERRLRLVAAERALAAGNTVTDVAYDAGYASPSAFINAFRRAFGTTPRRRSGQDPLSALS